MEFFELYGRNFNYDEVGLSIRRGGYYFSKRARRWTRPGQSFLLSIEDPQDPGERLAQASGQPSLPTDNDISGGSYGIRTVRAIFSGAFDLLQNKLFERTGELAGRSSGRIRGEWDPEEMSLLTAIMGITKEVRGLVVFG
jgi:non-canonical poly(A) RNA polymerase PAPD5/7